MADEEEKGIKKRPVLDAIFRLLCVYLAAKFLFSGIEHWRGGKLLQSGIDFSLVLAELGIIFGWHNHKSKIVRSLTWAGIIAAFSFLIIDILRSNLNF